MFKIALGSSSHSDTALAIGDAIAQALSGLDGTVAQAGLLFNQGHDSDSTLLRAIHDTWPTLKLVGSASDASADMKAIHLLLMSSPDLDFHLGLPPSADGDADLAAERALAEFMPQAQRLALYLQLGNIGESWQRRFEHAVQRLLPDACRDLTSLLPAGHVLEAPQRYYLGRSCVSAPGPLLLAAHRQADNSGWQMTRQPGIVRKQQNEAVWIYDTLLGDRRRKPAA